MHSNDSPGVDSSSSAVDATAPLRRQAWPLPVTTARLRLRRLRSEDLPAFQAYRNDPEVGRFQGWQAMTDAAAGDFIATMAAVSGPIQGEWIQLAIAERDSDALIGDAGVQLAANGREAELGLSLARRCQGRGLASEAFALLLNLLFQHSACISIRGVIDAQNSASLRLVERHGFEHVDTLDTIFRGAPCIERVYRLNKSSATA